MPLLAGKHWALGDHERAHAFLGERREDAIDFTWRTDFHDYQTQAQPARRRLGGVQR